MSLLQAGRNRRADGRQFHGSSREDTRAQDEEGPDTLDERAVDT